MDYELEKNEDGTVDVTLNGFFVIQLNPNGTFTRIGGISAAKTDEFGLVVDDFGRIVEEDI